MEQSWTIQTSTHIRQPLQQLQQHSLMCVFFVREPAYVTRGLSPAQHCLVGCISLVEPVVKDLVVCSLVVTVLCHLLVEGLSDLLVLSLGGLTSSLELLIPALSTGNARLQDHRLRKQKVKPVLSICACKRKQHKFNNCSPANTACYQKVPCRVYTTSAIV